MINDTQIQYWKEGDTWQVARCNICFRHLLGERIDIIWNTAQAIMKISPTIYSQQIYQITGQTQLLGYVKLEHESNCPMLQLDISKNADKMWKPCSSIMLKDIQSNQFLITKRSNTVPFPSAWMLPGGKLESGQGIFEGGIRQCMEEVGLPKDKYYPQVEKQIMARESINCSEGKIISAALVIFIGARCRKFQQKIEQNSVESTQWRTLSEKVDERPYNFCQKSGYGRGDLAYFQMLRSKQ